jgi:RNA polymerase sigma factor (sigma-70 family)
MPNLFTNEELEKLLKISKHMAMRFARRVSKLHLCDDFISEGYAAVVVALKACEEKQILDEIERLKFVVTSVRGTLLNFNSRYVGPILLPITNFVLNLNNNCKANINLKIKDICSILNEQQKLIFKLRLQEYNDDEISVYLGWPKMRVRNIRQEIKEKYLQYSR